MPDRDEIPVETTEGRHGGSGMGDRLLVGLAGLALVSGILIVAGKGLNGQPDTASHSGAPSATPFAGATGTPEASPAVVTVESRPLPSPRPPSPASFSGWIRVKRDLPVYDDRRTDANRIGSLPKGSLAYAEDPPEPAAGSQSSGGIQWLIVDQPSPQGYIAGAKGGESYVQRLVPSPSPLGGSVNGLAAGPNGFVAWGYQSGASDKPQQAFLATSADGRSWQPADISALGDAWIQGVAHGPAGWLLTASVARGEGETTTWLWRSTDGRSWHLLGAFPIDTSEREVTLLGSEAGYLLVLDTYRAGNTQGWHSIDGSSWRQANLPTGIGLKVIAARSGFLAWLVPPDGAVQPTGAYSADGLRWLTVDPPPVTNKDAVVTVGDGLLAVAPSPVTGAPRVWRGTFSGSGLTWAQQASNLPRNVGVASVASDGQTAILFGWNRETDAPVAWSSRGSGWTPVTLPAGAFGGNIPNRTVASAPAFVALGSQENLRAENPVFWAGNPDGEWTPESSPVVTAVGEKTDLRCPPRPVDAVGLVTLDIGAAVICFGASPITVRAYLGRCDGCSGQSADLYTPKWLADPQVNQLYLSPIKSQDSWFFSARRANGLADNPAWVDHWVELAGHFDDPAASQCRWVPDLHGDQVLYSAQSVINSCRQQFVVTRIRVVSGP